MGSDGGGGGERAAILGGPKAVTLDQAAANRWPILTEEDEAAVLAVMRDGDISCHPVTRELERDWAGRLGVRHALAHCNGTAALLACFHALDLEPGDEVLVPSATFWASVLPMLWVGAVPVFCESEPERLGLDPDDVRRRITPRTKAMVVVHLWGMPSRMTELLAIAEEHDLKVIEDASHALGATWRGRPCGTLGDVAAFSLQGSKLAPAGEGGIFVTNDDAAMERATCLGDIVRILELESPARRFAATSFGVKTRMHPLAAAIGRVQLGRFDERDRRRTENIVYLSERLEELGFHTYRAPGHLQRVYYEFIVRSDPARHGLDAETLVAALQAEGCEVTLPRYPLVHQQPFFTEGHWARVARIPAGGGASDSPTREFRPEDLPRTQAAGENLIRLPSFPGAERALLDQVAAAFEKVIGQADEIGARAGAAE